jgi:peptidoglycan-associated lipoprotein
MNKVKTLSFLFSAAALLSACSSTPVTAPPTSLNGTSATTPGDAAGKTPNATAESSVAAVTLPAYLDPKSDISTQRSVYFDFDDFSIKQDYAALIERHGKYLVANPALAIKLEGHADERGGSEYNLALGQKRADAAQRALKMYGVKDAQVESVSWGKEKPKAMGHDEAAWSQNRRVDLQYPTK